MTDTTTTATATMAIADLEPAPDNLRRKPRDGQAFRQLVESVRALGVLEPLLVTPNGGKHKIVAGNRRYEAAKEAGLAEVPVHVRPLTDREMTEVMLIENLQRSDLAPSEEGTGYLRLVEFGMTKKELAKRVGRSPAHVADRIRILDLPKKVQGLVDAGKVPIGAVEHLLKLEDRADVLAVVEEDPYSYEQAVARRTQARKAEAAVAKAWALAESSGFPVLEYDYNVPHGQKVKFLSSDSYDAIPLDAKAHRTESCHALVILAKVGKVSEACTDPSRHAQKGASELKLPKGAASSAGLSEHEKKQRAEAKEKKARQKVRREQVAELLGGKLPADAATAALKAFVLSANATQKKQVAEMLGLEPAKNPPPYDKFEPVLAKHMDGPAATTKAAVALTFVLSTETWEQGALRKHADRWFADNGVDKP